MTAHRSGPVRSDDARRAILTATAEQFAMHGYEGMTIQAIAAAAGVGKQTIYRWWTSKADLLAECLVERVLPVGDLVVTDTGDLHADVGAWLATMLDVGPGSAAGQLLLPLIGAAAGDEPLARSLDVLLHGGSAGGLGDRFEAAREQGQLPPDADPDAISENLIGIVLYRVLARVETSADEVAALASQALGVAATR